ncbi:hypothetical protein PHET_10421 [Paragonimus heterotremus]|uniref:Uncharacterized protein n=1 Tax=Paragonimus heterotremus TaxID=100268 RepID=A0A8J4SZF5_9TREM|nr:hypothetical protein PHET_10421 [Paragonimus heterotremus]
MTTNNYVTWWVRIINWAVDRNLVHIVPLLFSTRLLTFLLACGDPKVDIHTWSLFQIRLLVLIHITDQAQTGAFPSLSSIYSCVCLHRRLFPCTLFSRAAVVSRLFVKNIVVNSVSRFRVLFPPRYLRCDAARLLRRFLA